jgi:hypothetical protein
MPIASRFCFSNSLTFPDPYDVWEVNFLSYSVALQALKPKSSTTKKTGPGCKHQTEV